MKALPVLHRGVALITAILITALAGTVAMGLAWDNALDVRRTMVLLYRDQAEQVALGAENWVASILLDDLADSSTDHLDEIWAQELPGFPIDGGQVVGQIEDLQGRFNINTLVDADGKIVKERVEQFERLLIALEIEPRFAGMAADWIDADRTPAIPDGAEDAIYTSASPPYRPPNRPLTSSSELAALQGMDKASYDKLAPHVVALPGQTLLNANTASVEVIQSLDPSLTLADAERIIAERENGGFTDLNNTFSTYPELDLSQLGETSDYFRLMVVVQIDTVRLTYYSILQRSPNAVTPILRSFGTT